MVLIITCDNSVCNFRRMIVIKGNTDAFGNIKYTYLCFNCDRIRVINFNM